MGQTQKIARAGSTGWHHILCSHCDGSLGNDLDGPVFEWVTEKLPPGTHIKDTILAQFLASVFWRASLSNHHYCRNFLGPDHELTPFLKQATYDPKAAFEIASYDVKRITDNHFTDRDLKTVVIFPVLRAPETNMNETFICLRTVFGGCIWTMTFPRLQPQPDNILSKSQMRSTIDIVALKSDPELRRFIIDTIKKTKQGEVSHKLKTKK